VEHAPVARRVGENEQEMVSWIVAAFECDATFGRLDVAESHLELDAGALITAKEHRIPCPKSNSGSIAAHRHFGSIGQGSCGKRQERAKPYRLATVTDRDPTGVQADDGVEADDTRNPVDLRERQCEDLAGPDARVPGSRHATCGSDMGLTERELESPFPEL
jgi:hypothetical protein